jgi:hypothetical protein
MRTQSIIVLSGLVIANLVCVCKGIPVIWSIGHGGNDLVYYYALFRILYIEFPDHSTCSFCINNYEVL